MATADEPKAILAIASFDAFADHPKHDHRRAALLRLASETGVDDLRQTRAPAERLVVPSVLWMGSS